MYAIMKEIINANSEELLSIRNHIQQVACAKRGETVRSVLRSVPSLTEFCGTRGFLKCRLVPGGDKSAPAWLIYRNLGWF